MEVATDTTFDDLVAILGQGLSQRRVYFASHPRVRERVTDFVSRFDELLRRDRREFFFLGYAEEKLIHEGHFLVGPTILGRRIVEFLCDLDSGGILFRAGVTAEELVELFELAMQATAGKLDL
jgi:hypothetical protein